MLKSALIHDWLVTNAGAELVFKHLYNILPSPVYTLFHDKNILSENFLPDAEIHTSSAQKIPGILKHYRKLLHLFPLKIEEFDLNEYDLLLSSSHCVAKGVLTTAKQLHLCYIHSPVRYAWDMHFPYLSLSGYKGLRRLYARHVLHHLRTWDVISANRVDCFIANSHYIANRVKRSYYRDAEVIYPPVNTNSFELNSNKENYYIAVSRYVQYKRMDLIVEAFRKMPEKKLILIGGGPDEKKLKKMAAKSPNITIRGFVPFKELKETMEKAKAFVFAAEEDFGILPVQAQSAGTPVIAYGVGGACETVLPGKTGLLFNKQSAESIIETVKQFEVKEDVFDTAEIRKHSENFSIDVFQTRMKALINQKCREKFDKEIDFPE